MDFANVFAAAENSSQTASGAGVFGSLLCIIGMWKIFSKAGQPGWAAIIPIYNCYVLFDIAWGRPWKFLLLLIPIVNIVVYCMCMVRLAHAYGKGGGFAVGLILLPALFTLILGFGDSAYLGPQE